MSEFLTLYDEARERGQRIAVYLHKPRSGGPPALSEIGVGPQIRAVKVGLTLRQGLDDAAEHLREKLGW